MLTLTTHARVVAMHTLQTLTLKGGEQGKSEQIRYARFARASPVLKGMLAHVLPGRTHDAVGRRVVVGGVDGVVGLVPSLSACSARGLGGRRLVLPRGAHGAGGGRGLVLPSWTGVAGAAEVRARVDDVELPGGAEGEGELVGGGTGGAIGALVSLRDGESGVRVEAGGPPGHTYV